MKTVTYKNHAFWKAYNQLYWFPSTDPSIRKTAQNIVDNLRSDSNDCIRVLILGVGTGTFELPLISHISEITGKRIVIVAVDNAFEPLAFFGNLLAEGFKNLPKTFLDWKTKLEASKHPSINWSFPSINQVESLDGHGPHQLVYDDLSYEPDSIDKGVYFNNAPSKWAERIDDKCSLLNKDEQFDLVFASFILMHLDWWRPTLLEAIKRLRGGGIILHATVNHDEDIFEGREHIFKPKEITGVHSNKVAKEVFLKGFFEDANVQKIMLQPRSASATRPYSIDAFLERLSSFGLTRLNDNDSENKSFSYVIEPEVTAEDVYFPLLETRGFSTFRIMEEDPAIQTSGYNRLLEMIKSKMSNQFNEMDRLEIYVNWKILRLDCKSEFTKFPLLEKFGVFTQMSSQSVFSEQKALRNAYISSYEIDGAVRFHCFDKQPHILSENTAKNILTNGILNPHCLGGEFGFLRKDRSSIEFSIFSNPLYQHPDHNNNHDSKEIIPAVISQTAVYLALLKVRFANSRFSNTQILLSKVMPKAALPCIFSYKLSMSREDKPCVRISPHQQFLEISFVLPKTFQNNLIKSICWSIMGDVKKQVCAALVPNKAYKPYTYQLGSLLINNDAVSSIVNILSDFIDKHQITKNLKDSLLDNDCHKNNVHTALTEAIETNGREIAFSLLATFLDRSIKRIVIYPATYYENSLPSGKEVAIMLYDEHFTDDELEHEYIKVNQLFERLGMTHALESGIAKRNADIFHQIPKDFATLDNNLSKLREYANTPHAELRNIRYLIPNCDAMAFMIMTGDAAVGRLTYQLLPGEFPKALENECTWEVVNKIFERLVIPYVLERIQHEDVCQCQEYIDARRNLCHEIYREKYPFPRIEKFDTLLLQDGGDIYIWMLLSLRNAAFHAYQPIVSGESNKQGVIYISYCTISKNLKISNTGVRPLDNQSPHQLGWKRDLAVFRRSEQKWSIIEIANGIFSQWCEDEQHWITIISHA